MDGGVCGSWAADEGGNQREEQNQSFHQNLNRESVSPFCEWTACLGL
jgi:hypothetical protein